MTLLTLAIIAMTAYLLATLGQAGSLWGCPRMAKPCIWVGALIALVIHGYLLHLWIDVESGQNLSVVNVVSMVLWMSALLVALVSMRRATQTLGLFAYPLAALSILMVMLFPGFYILNTGANPKQLIHILLSMLAFSVFCLATLQALLMSIQERVLRRKHTMGIIRVLPPQETMESLLFAMLVLGFILLSLVLLSSVIFFDNYFAHGLWQKTLLAILAWLTFGGLIIGRFAFGWRGQTAIRWTLSGMVFLILAYFSSRLLAEFLL